jgi:tRNA-dihydrouridine synthase B
MKIGNLEFKKGIFLAPMAGVTDAGFRYVCSLCGAELTTTEMISSKGLYYGSDATKNLLECYDDKNYKCVQIFGSDPFIMGQVCKLDCLKKFDIININMGCPAPKIFNNGDGSALMKNLDLAESIIKECKKNASVPITVKFRLGINEKTKNAVDFAKMCEKAGADAIIIHGRYREQYYSGKVDYASIKEVVDAVKIPVIGNGDIVDEESMKKMFDTGCSGVMIGRGALGNPLLFSKLTGTKCDLTRFECFEKHLEILRKIYNEKYLYKYMRKHYLWYVNSVPNASSYRAQLATCKSTDEALKILKNILGDLR